MRIVLKFTGQYLEIQSQFLHLFKNVKAGRTIWADISSEDGRTKPQNNKLHPIIRDVSKQVEWCGKKRSEGAWKLIFLDSLFDTEHIMGLHDRPVAICKSTSELTVNEASELVELIYAFGANHGVEWSEPKENGNG